MLLYIENHSNLSILESLCTLDFCRGKDYESNDCVVRELSASYSLLNVA